MLIWKAAVGKVCLLLPGPDGLQMSGKANTESSGLPGLYSVKSARYSSAQTDRQAVSLLHHSGCKARSRLLYNFDKTLINVYLNSLSGTLWPPGWSTVSRERYSRRDQGVR